MNFGGSVRLNPCGLLVLGLITLFLIYYTFGRSNETSPNNIGSISIKALLAASIDIAKKGGQQVKMIRDQVHMYYLSNDF